MGNPEKENTVKGQFLKEKYEKDTSGKEKSEKGQFCKEQLNNI